MSGPFLFSVQHRGGQGRPKPVAVAPPVPTVPQATPGRGRRDWQPAPPRRWGHPGQWWLGWSLSRHLSPAHPCPGAQVTPSPQGWGCPGTLSSLRSWPPRPCPRPALPVGSSPHSGAEARPASVLTRSAEKGQCTRGPRPLCPGLLVRLSTLRLGLVPRNFIPFCFLKKNFRGFENSVYYMRKTPSVFTWGCLIRLLSLMNIINTFKVKT